MNKQDLLYYIALFISISFSVLMIIYNLKGPV